MTAQDRLITNCNSIIASLVTFSKGTPDTVTYTWINDDGTTTNITYDNVVKYQQTLQTQVDGFQAQVDSAVASIGADNTKTFKVADAVEADDAMAFGQLTKANIDFLDVDAATVNGLTVEAPVPADAVFTDTHTPVTDNLSSTSTTEALSANQGKVLAGIVDNKATLKVENSNELNIAYGFNQDRGKVHLNYRGASKVIDELYIGNGVAGTSKVRLSNIADALYDDDALSLGKYKALKQGVAYTSLQDILDKNEWIGNGRYKIVNADGRPSEVYCVKDEDTGNIYMVLGKFAGNSHDTVAGTIPTRDVVIDNASDTVFSSNFGEQICQEVRFVGVTNIEGDWKTGRQLDFSHLIPANRKWKHTFTSGQESGMPRVERNGYAVTGMHNYLNNWQNDKTSFHRISDANAAITAQAFIQEGSFYLNGAQDAKFTIAYDVAQVGQDSYVSAGFGRDDNHRFAFEDNQTNTNNIGAEKINFSTPVYVLVR